MSRPNARHPIPHPYNTSSGLTILLVPSSTPKKHQELVDQTMAGYFDSVTFSDIKVYDLRDPGVDNYTTVSVPSSRFTEVLRSSVRSALAGVETGMRVEPCDNCDEWVISNSQQRQYRCVPCQERRASTVGLSQG